MLKALIITASVAVSTAAFAAPARLTDVQFMHLARCRALAASTQLGGGDAAPFDAVLKAQRMGRDPFIADRAGQIDDDTARAARRAGPDARAKLIAERDGATCRSYLGDGATMAGGAGANGGHSVN